MRKIVAAINMTLDGFCDHTAILPDEALHDHYTDLLKNGDTILYGRITYQLMEYWKTIVETPTDEKSMNDFAAAMNGISKVVFSRTLNDPAWETARLATRELEEEVKHLQQQPGSNVLVGSRSLIVQLMKLNLLDELQLCLHPVVAGKGLPLFENLNDRITLKLSHTKTFNSGAIILYYERLQQETT